jgi:hypothetical protein
MPKYPPSKLTGEMRLYPTLLYTSMLAEVHSYGTGGNYEGEPLSSSNPCMHE